MEKFFSGRKAILLDTSFIMTAVEIGRGILTSLDDLAPAFEKIRIKQDIDELQRLASCRKERKAKQ
ncbi:hypothetical protein DRN86_01895, partial [Candidatus Geothermarchaeota archaeon]